MRLFFSLLLALILMGCNSSMGIWSSRSFTGLTFGNDRDHLGEVLGDIKISENNSYVELKPNKHFSIDFEIDFPSKIISKQSCHLQLINGNYKSDL